MPWQSHLAASPARGPQARTAAQTLRDLRVGEVKELDMKIEGGKVVAYRAKVSLSFKYEA